MKLLIRPTDLVSRSVGPVASFTLKSVKKEHLLLV